MRLFLAALFCLALLSGCATFGEPEFVTQAECDIALRLKKISVERHFQCIVDRLPEYGFEVQGE